MLQVLYVQLEMKSSIWAGIPYQYKYLLLYVWTFYSYMWAVCDLQHFRLHASWDYYFFTFEQDAIREAYLITKAPKCKLFIYTLHICVKMLMILWYMYTDPLDTDQGCNCQKVTNLTIIWFGEKRIRRYCKLLRLGMKQSLKEFLLNYLASYIWACCYLWKLNIYLQILT